MYEDYAQTKLVDTGKMSPAESARLQDIGQAVNDLKAGRIQTVWLDLLPAQDYVTAGGVKIAAQDLNQQTVWHCAEERRHRAARQDQ